MAVAIRRHISRYFAAILSTPKSLSTPFLLLNKKYSYQYHHYKIPQTTLPAFVSVSSCIRYSTVQNNLQPGNEMQDHLHPDELQKKIKRNNELVDKTDSVEEFEEVDWDKIYGVIHQYGSSPDLENALDELDLTLKYPLMKWVLERLAQSEKLAFRFLLWAVRQPTYAPNLDVYAIMVRILTDSHRLTDMLTLIMELRQEGCSFTPKGFVVVMGLYGYAGMADRALEAFHRMERLCCKPTAPAYNALLTVLCKAQKIKLANEIYDRMLKYRCVPNSMTYSILMDGWLKCGEVKRAQWLLKKSMKRKAFPCPESIAFLVNSMCREGSEVDHAFNIVIKLADNGCPLNTSVFNTLIRKYCQFRKREQVFQICEYMEGLGLPPDNVTYALLTRLFVAKLEKVREILDTMTKKGLKHDAHTLHGFIAALCRRRRLNEACKVFESMLKNNFKPDVGTYTLLFKGLCIGDRAQDALRFFREMEKRCIVPNIEMFSILIRGHCKQGNIDEAFNLFNELDEMNIIPDIGTYRIVEKSLIKARRKDEAEKLLHRMLLKGYNQKLRLHVPPKALNEILDNYR